MISETIAAPKKDFKLMSDQMAFVDINNFKKNKLTVSYKNMLIQHFKNILDEHLQFFTIEKTTK